MNNFQIRRRLVLIVIAKYVIFVKQCFARFNASRPKGVVGNF